jgi:tRNA-2-methylthio-N6-dimethylallyladenosine synthase
VLVEKPRRLAGHVAGRSPYLQAVHMAGDIALRGEIVPVEILAVGNNSLLGKIVMSGEPKSASVIESRAAAAPAPEGANAI